MIELNLLPRDYRKVQKEKKSFVKIRVPKIKIAPTPLIIGAISVLFVSQGIMGILAATYAGRLAKTRVGLNKIAPQEELARQIKKELDELNRRSSVIESLTSGSLLWSKKLYDLNHAVTDGVWLNSLSLNTETAAKTQPTAARRPAIPSTAAMQAAERQTLILSGSAVSTNPGEETAIIGKFIESLKNNKNFFEDFEDIKLSSIQRTKAGNIEIMKFTIVCYFKPGRSYFEKLAARNI